MKVTLIKDWKTKTGLVKKKGLVIGVTNSLKKELEKGGYVSSDEKTKKNSKEINK